MQYACRKGVARTDSIDNSGQLQCVGAVSGVTRIDLTGKTMMFRTGDVPDCRSDQFQIRPPLERHRRRTVIRVIIRVEFLARHQREIHVICE